MGIRNRDYMYEETGRTHQGMRSATAMLIAANCVVWVVQVLCLHTRFQLETYLATHPDDVFGSGFLWQVVTGNFLHAPKQILHIAMNMFGLYLFGRELEVLYGRWKFALFFVLAGSVALSAEAALAHFVNGTNPTILGASGAVMGIVVLFTLHFPKRELQLIVIPVPVWALCLLWIGGDLLGAMGGGPQGGTSVAFIAHLAGAAFGAAWRLWELKGVRIQWRRRHPARRRARAKILEFHVAADAAARQASLPEEPSGHDSISDRIDLLLEKISRSGKESLTGEELKFLQDNSGRYRSSR